jgi:hypothetical protein
MAESYWNLDGNPVFRMESLFCSSSINSSRSPSFGCPNADLNPVKFDGIDAENYSWEQRFDALRIISSQIQVFLMIHNRKT